MRSLLQSLGLTRKSLQSAKQTQEEPDHAFCWAKGSYAYAATSFFVTQLDKDVRGAFAKNFELFKHVLALAREEKDQKTPYQIVNDRSIEETGKTISRLANIKSLRDTGYTLHDIKQQRKHCTHIPEAEANIRRFLSHQHTNPTLPPPQLNHVQTWLA